jgi:hypothetical protein
MAKKKMRGLWWPTEAEASAKLEETSALNGGRKFKVVQVMTKSGEVMWDVRPAEDWKPGMDQHGIEVKK